MTGDEVDPAPEDSDAAEKDAAEKDTDEATETEWERKRRLAEIFGDVLPSTTRDERDPGAGAKRKESAQDAWLRSQVPPHHGGH